MRKKTIHLSLRGRFGNQLFQYSFAYSLIKKGYADELCLHIPTELKDSIACCNLKCKCTTKKFNRIRVFNFKDWIWLFLLLTKNIFRLNRHFFSDYIENNKQKAIAHGLLYEFNRMDMFPYLFTKRNYYMEGYFEIPSFFREYLIELKKIIFTKQISDSCLQLLNLVIKTNSVCVSVRRGDFVSKKENKDRFDVCNREYFYKAIDMIKSLTHQKLFLFFFSDDIEWCKQTFNKIENAFFESGNDTVYDKLFLMSKCNHFIISNSTFSWWAQELSDNVSKIVIAPRNWRKDIRDSFLNDKSWILL